MAVELAAHVVPPVPLDWCVAQTQATIGFTLTDELDAALAARDLPQRTAGLVTRTIAYIDRTGGIPALRRRYGVSLPQERRVFGRLSLAGTWFVLWLVLSAALPPEEPPGPRLVSQGLQVVP